MSALHQAALSGNVDIMRLLLEHGAVVDIADSKSKSTSQSMQRVTNAGRLFHIFSHASILHFFVFLRCQPYFIPLAFLSSCRSDGLHIFVSRDLGVLQNPARVRVEPCDGGSDIANQI